MKKDKTCCFTGHRKLPLEFHQGIKKQLEFEVEKLIKAGVTTFMAGGALGFDTLAALTVLKCKKKYSQVKLFMIYPCKNQTKGWDKKSTLLYEYIKKQADSFLYIAEEYSRACMFQRNRYLVDHSKYCICYLTRNQGGTAYTVHYAEKKGITITNIAAVMAENATV